MDIIEDMSRLRDRVRGSYRRQIIMEEEATLQEIDQRIDAFARVAGGHLMSEIRDDRKVCEKCIKNALENIDKMERLILRERRSDN